MVFQGNLLDLNWDTLYFYNNTLQAIAVGYLGAVVIMQLDNIKKQILVTLALLILYWLLLHFAGTGNLTANSNLAGEIDTLIFNTHRDGQEYTWLLSSVNFIVTVMLGAFCGKVLMQDKDNIKKLLQLVYFAMTCLALGYLLSFQDPIIKKIWTSSFTLISGGYCILLLAVFKIKLPSRVVINSCSLLTFNKLVTLALLNEPLRICFLS